MVSRETRAEQFLVPCSVRDGETGLDVSTRPLVCILTAQLTREEQLGQVGNAPSAPGQRHRCAAYLRGVRGRALRWARVLPGVI